jgi:chemotaxis protein CheZ
MVKQISEDSQPAIAEQSSSGCSIFETTAQILETHHLSTTTGEQVPVITAVRDLLRALGSGEPNRVEESLVKLGGKSNHELFTRVGQMTRALHDSLRDFKTSLDVKNVTLTTTNIPDAASKLEAVIKATFEAANKTLELCESTETLLTSAERRHKKLVAAAQGQLSESELRATLSEFIVEDEKFLRSARSHNGEVLMAQGFQDLTGQALRKVILLVTELESNLLSLIQVLGHSTSTTATTSPSTPSGSGDVSDNKLAQDDVDSMLSNLGF